MGYRKEAVRFFLSVLSAATLPVPVQWRKPKTQVSSPLPPPAACWDFAVTQVQPSFSASAPPPSSNTGCPGCCGASICSAPLSRLGYFPGWTPQPHPQIKRTNRCIKPWIAPSRPWHGSVDGSFCSGWLSHSATAGFFGISPRKRRSYSTAFSS